MSTPSAERQIGFLSDLQRLLGEGSFVATYKFALLLALADISVEHGHDDDERLTSSTPSDRRSFHPVLLAAGRAVRLRSRWTILDAAQAKHGQNRRRARRHRRTSPPL